jgi:hypothetical protein
MVCSLYAQKGKPRHALCCNLHLPLFPLYSTRRRYSWTWAARTSENSSKPTDPSHFARAYIRLATILATGVFTTRKSSNYNNLQTISTALFTAGTRVPIPLGWPTTISPGNRLQQHTRRVPANGTHQSGDYRNRFWRQIREGISISGLAKRASAVPRDNHQGQ